MAAKYFGDSNDEDEQILITDVDSTSYDFELFLCTDNNVYCEAEDGFLYLFDDQELVDKPTDKSVTFLKDIDEDDDDAARCSAATRRG